MLHREEGRGEAWEGKVWEGRNKNRIKMIPHQILLYLMTTVLFLVTLSLTLWVVKCHWYNVGQEPEWQRRVLSLLLLFPLHTCFGFLLPLTLEKYTHYTMAFIIALNTIILHQIYQLFLFLFNKQSVLYFHSNHNTTIDYKRDGKYFILEDTIRVKMNYCFFQCTKAFLQGEEVVKVVEGEEHPILRYSATFLSATEFLLIGQMFLSGILLSLTLSLGHLEMFATYFLIPSLICHFLAFLSILCLCLFLLVTDKVIDIYKPRFKLSLIILPMFTSFVVPLLYTFSLSSFIIQMEQLILLIASLWVFSPEEHLHIRSINTQKV